MQRAERAERAERAGSCPWTQGAAISEAGNVREGPGAEIPPPRVVWKMRCDLHGAWHTFSTDLSHESRKVHGERV